MKTIKETLRASMMGKVGRLIYIPSYIEPTEEETVSLIIVISSRKDEALRSYLENIPSRSRTGYIKTVLRLNLGLSYIRDEFFGIDSEQIIAAKPLIEVKQTTPKQTVKRPSNFPPRTNNSQTVQPTPVSIPVSTPTPTVTPIPVQMPITTNITPTEAPATPQDDEDDIFSMLTNLIDD